jgi:eukaryotic-like serine/threonine-protein kinase
MADTQELPATDHGAPAQFSFGDFQLDVPSRQLLRATIRVPISAKAFDTLLVLVQRQGTVVTKDELISAVWPDTFVSEDSLTQNISALRRILEDDPVQPKFIATVARRGYQFIAPVTTEVGRATPLPNKEEPAALPPVVAAPVDARGGIRRVALLAAVAGLIVGTGLGAALAWRFYHPAASRSMPVRFVMDVPAGLTIASGGAVSPDGQYVAFVASDEQSGQMSLWIRSVSAGTLRRLPSTEDALRPFWSPDSQSVAFFGSNHLRRIALTGGQPISICDTIAPRPLGGTWSERGDIVFADASELYIVPSQGGTPRPALRPDIQRDETALSWPQFLPGGQRFLYGVDSGNPAVAGTYTASVTGGDKRRLTAASATQVAYTQGALLYLRDRQLIAQPFDTNTASFAGTGTVVAEDVDRDGSLSASMAAVVSIGGAPPDEQLTWYDRTGDRLGTLAVPEPLRDLSISPDHRTLVASGIDPRRPTVWLLDVVRGVATRLSDGAFPSWAPDGNGVFFSRAAGNPRGIYSRSLGGTTNDLVLSGVVVLNDVTRDGRFVVYVVPNTPTRQDVWIWARDGKQKPSLLLGSTAREIQAQVSPDGRWIAYASDEDDGIFQVYVQAFPGLGAKQRVSSNGGTQPQWRSDSRELFYLAPDQMLMAVDAHSGASLTLGPPRSLFRMRLPGSMTDYRNQYAPSADGSRFVASTLAGARNSITLLINWRPQD